MSSPAAAVDDQGRCASHPFVQLQRLSARTGEWKALLDECPLCAMDGGRSQGGGDGQSVCSSVYSGYSGYDGAIEGAEDFEDDEEEEVMDGGEAAEAEEEESRRDGGERDSRDSRRGGRDLEGEFERKPSRERGRTRGRASASDAAVRPRSTSRVRFGPTEVSSAGGMRSQSTPRGGGGGGGTPRGIGGLSDLHRLSGQPSPGSYTGGQSVGSASASASKSALKEPRYRVCREAMRRQLDESERVTTMSMDLDIADEEDDASVPCDDVLDEESGDIVKRSSQADDEEFEEEGEVAVVSDDEGEGKSGRGSNDNEGGEENFERFHEEEAEERGGLEPSAHQSRPPSHVPPTTKELPRDLQAAQEKYRRSKSKDKDAGRDSSRDARDSSGGRTKSLRHGDGSSAHNARETERGSKGKGSGSSRRHRSKERKQPSSSSQALASRRSDRSQDTYSSSNPYDGYKPAAKRSSSCQVGYRSNSFHGSPGPSNDNAGDNPPPPARPDPEEFPCGGSTGAHSTAGSHGGRSRSSRRRAAPSPAPPAGGRPQARRSNSFHSQASGNFPPPPPPPPPPRPQQQQPPMASPGAMTASPGATTGAMTGPMTSPGAMAGAMTGAVASPGATTNAVTSPGAMTSAAGGNYLVPYTPTILAHPNYDDEISTLSYMGASVQSGGTIPTLSSANGGGAPRHGPGRGGGGGGGGGRARRSQADSWKNYRDANAAEGDDPPVRRHRSAPDAGEPYDSDDSNQDNDNFEEAVPATNANECDDKGRCVRHPHVRLKKKKMFGRGWKILMSACPDCCVDELRRIRSAEENKRKMSKKLGRRGSAAASGSVNGGGGLDESGRSGGRRGSAAGNSVADDRSYRSGNVADDRSYRSGHSHQLESSQRSGGREDMDASQHSSAPTIKRGTSGGGVDHRSSLRSQGSFQGAGLEGSYRQGSLESVGSGGLRGSLKSTSSFGSGSVSGTGGGPPPPPPRRSPSVDATGTRSPGVNAATTGVKGKLRRPSEDTASLTGTSSSSQSSGEAGNAAMDGSDRSSQAPQGPAQPGQVQPRGPHRKFQNRSQASALQRQGSQTSSSAGSGGTRKARGGRDRSTSRDPRPSSRQGQGHAQGRPQVHPQVPSVASPGAVPAAKPSRGTIHVRRMRWSDPLTGREGQYTGQVDDRFVPHGEGRAEYDDGEVVEGEWRGGRCRGGAPSLSSNHASPPSSSSRGSSKTRPRGTSRETSGRSRSKSRERSSRGPRARSSSRSRPLVQ